MLTRLPSGPSGSTIAGILLLGLIARKSAAICSPLVMFTGKTLYGSSISSSATLILRPFGVFQVCSSIGSIVIFCRTPRKRGIQYSKTSRPYNRPLGILDRPLLRTMTHGPVDGRFPLWHVRASADRLRPRKAQRKNLVQVSLPRPPRRDHPQALVRSRRNHAGLGPQERFLFQSQADHARSRGRRLARGTAL